LSGKEQIRVHLIVEGRVQGVCYRMYTADEAQRLGVSGWVKNLPDGTVEVLAEGDTEKVMALVDWCRHGPSYATVTKMLDEYLEPTGELHGFEIAR
jgi:acylphosphatase